MEGMMQQLLSKEFLYEPLAGEGRPRGLESKGPAVLTSKGPAVLTSKGPCSKA
jgi:hypothetical protein